MLEVSEQYFNKIIHGVPVDPPRDKSEDVIQRENTKKFTSFLKQRSSKLIRLFSIAHYYAKCLGSKPEDRFTVPRYVDHTIDVIDGIKCVEEPEYDIVYEDIKISNKSQMYSFHTETRFNVKPKQETESISLFNTFGAGGKRKKFPKFDCLLIYQHTPYLVCATVAYPDVCGYFKSNGSIRPIPFSVLEFILNPYDRIHPDPLPDGYRVRLEEEIHERQRSKVIEDFVRDI